MGRRPQLSALLGGRRLLRVRRRRLQPSCDRLAAREGGFKWSSQRSIEEGCDGQAEGLGVGSDGAASDAFAGASTGGAPRASPAVLGGDRARRDEHRSRCGGWGVGRGGCPMVSGGWRHADGHSGPAVGPVLVVRRARGDRAACTPPAAGCGRSPVSSVGHRRRSLVSCAAMRPLVAAVWTIEPRRRSGMPTCAPDVPSRRSWRSTPSCAGMCRTVSPGRSSGRTGAWWRVRRSAGLVVVMAVARTGDGRGVES